MMVKRSGSGMLPFSFLDMKGRNRGNEKRNAPFKKETWCESTRGRSAKEVKKKTVMDLKE